MTEKKVTIRNKLGLHARPSALFVKTSSQFEADITVSKGELEINGKSIMSLMMLAAEPNSEITIKAVGEDEEKAIAALVELIETTIND